MKNLLKSLLYLQIIDANLTFEPRYSDHITSDFSTNFAWSILEYLDLSGAQEVLDHLFKSKTLQLRYLLSGENYVDESVRIVL